MVDQVRKFPPAARIRVVEDLVRLKRRMGSMISRWRCTTTVFDNVRRHVDGQVCAATIGGNGRLTCAERSHVWARKRELDEFPENSREEWLRLASWSKDMRSELAFVESYALERVRVIDGKPE